ncbi:MAG: biopolymer transporter ExbD [Phycisphaeraceae bacterium]|nr:biopolymer transporter ExbD [Phycisphaeraceae bacterium]MCW5769794.1 biopolymer transporter ExbD [Phycisphaeraceae bacterium]
MNFRPSRTRGSRSVFDMTPMIDVVFQLIIFFMFTSQFSQMARMRMDLPRHKGEVEEPAPASLVIDVTADGAAYLDAVIAGPDRLSRVVALELENARRENRQFQVLIRADRSCPAAYVNLIAERLKDVGVERWKLATSGGTP